MTLPAFLLKLRLDAGTTRTASAASVGIDQSTLYRWEHGETRPDHDQLARLLDLYRANVDERAEAERLRRLALPTPPAFDGPFAALKGE